MKLSKILGLLLVVAMMFVFVGCGDKGIILLENYSGNPFYEGYTIVLNCTYSDLSSFDEVQTISVHNKTTGKIISSVESKPCEFDSFITIYTDFTWVSDEKKENIYEFYVQMGDKVSNTVSVTVRNAIELLCDPEGSDFYLEDLLNAFYTDDDTVYEMSFDNVSFRLSKHIPLHLVDIEPDLKADDTVYRYLKLENEDSFTKTEVTLTLWKDSLSSLFDESNIGEIYQIYYEYPEENIKTDIMNFKLIE